MRTIEKSTYVFAMPNGPDNGNQAISIENSINNIKETCAYMCSNIPGLKYKELVHDHNQRYGAYALWFEENPSCGLLLTNKLPNNDSTHRELTIYPYKKTATGDYLTASNDSDDDRILYPGYELAKGGNLPFIDLLNTGHKIKFEYITIDNLKVLNLSLIGATGNEFRMCGFASMSCVDHFTGENKNCCLYFPNTDLPLHSSYRAYISLTDDNVIGSDLYKDILVGGTVYPPRNLSMVTPITFSTGSSISHKFYGYAADPTFLYAAYNGNTRINYDYKTEVTIGGHSFIQLFPGFLVRLD